MCIRDSRITVISDESDYFFSRTALMYVYMGHMRQKEIQPYEDWFWEKNRIERFRGKVAQVNYDSKTLQTTQGAVSYTHLRAHETVLDLVCRLLLEKKKTT